MQFLSCMFAGNAKWRTASAIAMLGLDFMWKVQGYEVTASRITVIS